MLVNRFVVGRHTVEIHYDWDGVDVRNDYDNFGTICHWHSRYNFGDKIEGSVQDYLRGLVTMDYNHPEHLFELQWEKMLENQYVVLPVALLDHSGLRMWVGSEHSPFDPGGWDSGQVGFIYASLEDARRNWMLPKATWKTRIPWSKYTDREVDDEGRVITPVKLEPCRISMRDATVKVLTGEIETYDHQLSGECYSYVVLDPEGEVVDSCCGFLGDSGLAEARVEGRSAAESRDEDLDELGVQTCLAECYP